MPGDGPGGCVAAVDQLRDLRGKMPLRRGPRTQELLLPSDEVATLPRLDVQNQVVHEPRLADRRLRGLRRPHRTAHVGDRPEHPREGGTDQYREQSTRRGRHGDQTQAPTLVRPAPNPHGRPTLRAAAQ